MSYTRRWAVSMPPDFYADQFTLEADPLAEPHLCDEHLEDGRPICFLAYGAGHPISSSDFGTWWIDFTVPVVMPGNNPKLVGLSIKGMEEIQMSVNHKMRTNIILKADGTKVWESGEFKNGQNGQWKLSEWNQKTGFEVDLTGVNTLTVGVYQLAGTPIGQCWLHNGYLTLQGEYQSEVAPLTGEVEVFVYNQETGSPISGAVIKILSGSQVIAQGTTDANGQEVIPNVEEGGYVLRIIKSGYEPFEESIQVTSPGVSVVYYVPSGARDWMWWLNTYWWAIPVSIGGLVLIGTLTGRRMPSWIPVPYQTPTYRPEESKLDQLLEYLLKKERSGAAELESKS